MKKDTTTNALELLMAQHEEVEDLIEQIEDSDDPEEKADLFAELADNLAAHATIEEKLFYPAVMTEATCQQLVESSEEHLVVKRLLADMMALGPDDDHFDAKLKVLKENVRHHAHDEEEDKLFPQVKKMFGEDELAALGGELLAMFETLMDAEPRRNVPAETAEAAEIQPMA
jgi:hemerythrin superfamily protein